MSKTHKVFISFNNEDKKWENKLENLVQSRIVTGSVQDDDFHKNEKVDVIRQKIRDDYLHDSSVTIVLIGKETWRRKHVDWEISASIRKTKNSPRSGLLGIILPSYFTKEQPNLDHYTIPPRLSMNNKNEYAEIYQWTDNPQSIQKWIHNAYNRKDKTEPDNSHPLFRRNHRGPRWYPHKKVKKDGNS